MPPGDRPTRTKRPIRIASQSSDVTSTFFPNDQKFYGVTNAEVDLARLKRQIKHNERIWSGFRRIEIGMIGAQSMHELATVLFSEFVHAFPQVNCVTLASHDPEYELTRLLDSTDDEMRAAEADDEQELEPIQRSFINLESSDLARLFPGRPRPRLLRCDRVLQKLLFPYYPNDIGSVALAPLVLHGQLIGTLNQGSRDPAHFMPDAATDLLEHLAAVTAMCIDNVINRERLRSYGLTDVLTGIANRRFFERRLDEEIERWFRRQEPLACMLVDVDHFKQINDNYGHQIGDRVLKEVAGLLGHDLRGADVLARYGGEEFVLLLPNATAQQGAAIAERLCDSIGRYSFIVGKGERRKITVSIGVSSLDRESELNGELPGVWLLHQADSALYEAKQSGRNRVVMVGSR